MAKGEHNTDTHIRKKDLKISSILDFQSGNRVSVGMFLINLFSVYFPPISKSDTHMHFNKRDTLFI